MAFLRYLQVSENHWHKFNTAEANQFLRKSHPQYLYHSPKYDADLHGVPVIKIHQHYKPREKLLSLLQSGGNDQLERTLIELTELFISNGINQHCLGVTGSVLIGAQNERSDLDLVIYDRSAFQKSRDLIRRLIGKGILSNLTREFWIDSYERRDCSLTFEEYVWHEQRKFNKAVFRGTKFDISLVTESVSDKTSTYTKSGKICIQSRITDDQFAFDTPSRYLIDDPGFTEVISFTPTYTAQAVKGELVEMSGFIETSGKDGKQRIVIGTSREAEGEYIKVVKTI